MEERAFRGVVRYPFLLLELLLDPFFEDFPRYLFLGVDEAKQHLVHVSPVVETGSSLLL